MRLTMIETTRLQAALDLLHQNARPGELAGMARFGIVGDNRLGLSMPAMRRIARTLVKDHALRRDHALALALWDTNIPDARILAGMVAEPAKLTSRQMDVWAKGFASWDVCDQVCGSAFLASPLAWRKLAAWASRNDEFVCRAAFALLATLAVHDKQAGDERFIATLALIEAAASDERNFVKKAVNWALRNIGKRNAVLNAAAIAAARRIQQQGSRSARWIAANALRELGSEAVQGRLQERQPKPIKLD
jgi:3-methyladenine DNA glycosylase AlkD